MRGGHIRIHRKILEWEWYGDTNTFRVFFHLLVSANYKDGRFQGQDVLRGQVIFGYPSLAKTLGISVKSVRTSISKLKSTGELAVQTTNRFSLGTIVNYDVYQIEIDETADETAVQPAVSGQSSGSQRATSKKNNKKKEEEESKGIYPRTRERVNHELEIARSLNTDSGVMERYRKMYEYIIDKEGDHLLKLEKSVMTVKQYADMSTTCAQEGYRSVKDVLDDMLNKPYYFRGKTKPKTLNQTIISWARPK